MQCVMKLMKNQENDWLRFEQAHLSHELRVDDYEIEGTRNIKTWHFTGFSILIELSSLRAKEPLGSIIKLPRIQYHGFGGDDIGGNNNLGCGCQLS